MARARYGHHVIAFFIRSLIFVLSAALGLLVADWLLPGFQIQWNEWWGFVICVLIFAALQSVLAPWIAKMARRYAPALLGGMDKNVQSDDGAPSLANALGSHAGANPLGDLGGLARALFPTVCEPLPTRSEARGLVGDDDLWNAYERAAFMIFPSLHEGYGLPIAEALAHGTPVITSDFGSTAEIARDGGCLLVDPRDDEQIVDAMRDGRRELAFSLKERTLVAR